MGSRAGLRAGSGFGPGRMGRVWVGPGSAGSGRAKLRSGWAGSNFGSGRGGFGVGPGFFRPFRPDRDGPGRAGLGWGQASGHQRLPELLRLSYIAVRAFAILKRTDTDYELDTVLSPQKEQPRAHHDPTRNLTQPNPTEVWPGPTRPDPSPARPRPGPSDPARSPTRPDAPPGLQGSLLKADSLKGHLTHHPIAH